MEDGIFNKVNIREMVLARLPDHLATRRLIDAAEALVRTRLNAGPGPLSREDQQGLQHLCTDAMLGHNLNDFEGPLLAAIASLVVDDIRKGNFNS